MINEYKSSYYPETSTYKQEIYSTYKELAAIKKRKPQRVVNQLVEVFCWWSHLGSNQGPTDYESVIFNPHFHAKPLKTLALTLRLP